MKQKLKILLRKKRDLKPLQKDNKSWKLKIKKQESSGLAPPPNRNLIKNKQKRKL